MSVADTLALARERLESAKVREPALAARLLMQHATGWNHGQIISRIRDELGRECEARFEALVDRALRHEPVHYILGEREFYGRLFKVTPAVLIPRPDTEVLVELAIAATDDLEKPRVLDIGTGSGVLAVTLAAQLPGARAVATDVSADALEVAIENSLANGVEGRVQFLHGDLSAGAQGPFDLIVSNPPYVPQADFEVLEANVRDYEPSLALLGGTDGLDFYRSIFALASSILDKEGAIAVEFGAGQQQGVRDIANANGFSVTEVRLDLAGKDRALLAYRGKNL